MENKIVYFEKAGDENTGEVLHMARKRADELGIASIVIASTSGRTGVKAVDVFKGMNLVIIGHAGGFTNQPADSNAFRNDNRKIIEDSGGKVFAPDHGLAGLSSAAFGIGEIITHSLGILGAGVKVACEVSAMAADEGYIPTDEDVIAIGGPGQDGGGADTALVLTPARVNRFFDLRIKEILCKPYVTESPLKTGVPEQ